MSKNQILLLFVVLGLTSAFFYFDLGTYFTVEYLKSQRALFDELVANEPLLVLWSFLVIYIAVTAVSLPGAAIMTLAAGAMFGVLRGTVVVSFASTIGATLAMLVSRFILRDQVQAGFARQLKGINSGMEKEGAFYLFTLRLVPIVPFFVINLAMGLTRISVPRFFIVSQAGMLAGTIVFVNAGTQLAQIDSLQGILSPGLVVSFVLLGVFPLIAKKFVELMKSRKVVGHRQFD